MSRNDLFLLVACAIIAMVISNAPGQLPRSSSLTIASLISPGGGSDEDGNRAMFQQSFDNQ